MEIDASVEMPRTIAVKMKNGSIVSISVTVPWAPKKCSKCKIFGHLDKNCPNRPAGNALKVWIPKASSKGEELMEGKLKNKEEVA